MSNAHLLQGIMEIELESMYSDKVWEHVEVLEKIKPIGFKRVYKRKRGVNGKAKTYKARLVVKDYSQKLDFNYEEPFSLVAMLKPITILLSITTHLNYEI